MKAAKILGLFLILAILPTLAFAEIVDPALTTYTDPVTINCEPPPPPPTEPTSYSTDIKAYGDQTASHSLGIMTVDSFEVTTSEFQNYGFDGTIDVMKGGACEGDDCSFGIAQGTFDVTNEWGSTVVETNVDLTNYTGNVDMSSYGGIAVCTTVPAAAYGVFDQSQFINQTIYGPNGSTSTYNGSQELHLGTNY